MEEFQFLVFYINILALNTFKIWISLILFLVGGLLSCSDFNQQEQLKKLEKLTNTTDSLSNVLKNSIPDSLNSMRQTMMNTEVALKNNITMDSVDLYYAKDMDTYKSARKRIGKINLYLVEVLAGCKKEKKQLVKLKEDIERGWGKRNKYNEYIKLEDKNIKTLISKTHVLQGEVVKVCEIYQLLHPKMKTLLGKVNSQ